MLVPKSSHRGRAVVIAPRGQYKKFASEVVAVPQTHARADVIAMLTRLIRKGEEIRGKTAAPLVEIELSTAVEYSSSDAAADRSA